MYLALIEEKTDAFQGKMKMQRDLTDNLELEIQAEYGPLNNYTDVTFIKVQMT